MKSVLITGCSSGFGKLMVSEFLAKDWKVVATYRNAEARASLLEEERRKYGERLSILSLDVTSREERDRARNWIAGNLGGRLDCLINNAGYGLAGALEDLGEDQLRRQMEVNFFGPVLLARELLPFLRAAQGRVIQVSSILGLAAMPMMGAYCASKFALEGLSESLRYELGGVGVQLCIVEPGGFGTRFNDSMAWGEKSRDEGSPYRLQTEAFQSLRSKTASGQTTDGPASVARQVARLASRRKMPLRRLCGKDARGLAVARRVLGSGAISNALSMVFRQAIKRESRS